MAMVVKDLIEELKKCDENKEVIIKADILILDTSHVIEDDKYVKISTKR